MRQGPPKPKRGDDAERAGAAVERRAAVKKDARAVAATQLARLAALLASQRKFEAAAFWRCFAAHPLLRNLTRRLARGVYDGAERPSRLFRVTDELTCVDVHETRRGSILRRARRASGS